MLRSALVAILAGTLLAFALPCASVCAAMPTVQTDTVDSHCARSESAERSTTAPGAPDVPCDDDCAGCSISSSQVSIPSTGLALDASPGHGLVAAASRFVSFEVRPATGAPPSPRLVEDPPPRDILALTTTLLI